MSELKQRALDLYKPPFRFDHGYIKDSNGHPVSDEGGGDQYIVQRIRGWGRITYMEEPEKLQDMVGELFAEALNEYWKPKPPMPSAGEIREWLSGLMGECDALDIQVVRSALVKFAGMTDKRGDV